MLTAALVVLVSRLLRLVRGTETREILQYGPQVSWVALLTNLCHKQTLCVLRSKIYF